MKIDLNQSSRTEEVVSTRLADLSMRRASRHLNSREYRPAGTVVNIDGVEVGLTELVVMAGPCSVESAEQMLRIAHEIKAAGATVLRGGAFKPRTSPYDFQGLGKAGLEHLRAASRETGLKVVTEVVRPPGG